MRPTRGLRARACRVTTYDSDVVALWLLQEPTESCVLAAGRTGQSGKAGLLSLADDTLRVILCDLVMKNLPREQHRVHSSGRFIQ